MLSRGYEIALQPSWPAFWAEASPLAHAHAEEVDGGVEPRRRFKVDEPRMNAICEMGVLKLITAHKDGRMVGYFTWNVTVDLESEGLLIGQQGAWYCAPGNWRAAVLMFDYSIEVLKENGVQCIFPHHRTQGRGANIGRFFMRRGAKLIQFGYCLWIGA